MKSLIDAIGRHWTAKVDIKDIERHMSKKGVSFSSARDLARFDQLHAGQLEATKLFAEWIKLRGDERVLDLGAGVGGSARFIAKEYGVQVVCTEIVKRLHEVGLELTKRADLIGRVNHLFCDILSYPDLGLFDIVWIQHVDIHICNKKEFYSCLKRYLPPDSRIVWHDWFKGKTDPDYPLPWSEDGKISFLIKEEEFIKLLEEIGFKVTRIKRLEDETHKWFMSSKNGIIHVLEKYDDSFPGYKKLDMLLREVKNVIKGIEEGRLIPFFGEATKL